MTVFACLPSGAGLYSNLDRTIDDAKMNALNSSSSAFAHIYVDTT
jgi:hypothetical protein